MIDLKKFKELIDDQIQEDSEAEQARALRQLISKRVTYTACDYLASVFQSDKDFKVESVLASEHNQSGLLFNNPDKTLYVFKITYVK